MNLLLLPKNECNEPANLKFKFRAKRKIYANYNFIFINNNAIQRISVTVRGINFVYLQCSAKKEYEKRKAKYHDNNDDGNSKKSDTPKADGNEIAITTDGDVNVNVQNLWEVNYMFNKAGCGLPIDEVSLLSLTMDAMAELNKYKSIR